MAAADWKGTVRIQSEPIWEAELISRLGAGSGEPSVWVTDLLDLRPAFYRRRVRVPTDRERRARQAAGRELHALIGSALAAPGYLEVRVRRDGVVGQIDLLEDEPTELKTTESLPEPETLAESRGSYLEQLAMYCALTDRPRGRLVVVEAIDRAPGRCQVYEVEFRSTAALGEEVRRRAAAFRNADVAGTPEGLPRCGWFGRGCEFQQAGVCACTGEEPTLPSRLGSELTRVRFDEGRSRALAERLRSLAGAVGPIAVERFRDLLYPRRAYFERKEPAPEAGEAGPSPVAPAGRDLYRGLLDALESGPSGEVTRVPVPTGEPLERVSCLAGHPFLLRVTRFPRHLSSEELLHRHPQYLLELGFRCAALGQADGWLLLGYERAEVPKDRLRVHRVSYSPIDVVEGLASDRAEALARALRDGSPGDLPACPGWMFSDCPYKDHCGCGATSPEAASPP